ncbi:MAG TPA: transglycosylase domain-containing protein [Croceibacterium sp.]|nr:transglycosylase domain-containing protein [Croceibacterium sp.]
MDETQQSRGEYFRYRIRRDANGALEWFRANWRAKRWFRWASVALTAFVALWIIVWTVVSWDLPDANKLLTYEPPLPTVVRGYDGGIVYSYAREHRVQLQFQDFPTQLINAYTSAEDKTFWTHGGVDIGGLLGAVLDYVTKIGSHERAKGGSTITQQVAKNILIGNEYSISRKLKEMILARRIEGVLSKQEIITLYLNEIPLGRRSFGVQAASRAYFDKDVDQLTLPEMAFLAILPKAPEQYSRPKYQAEALARRNYVLGEMVQNGHITQAQADAAKAEPLGIVTDHDETKMADAGYFLEEVRRELLAKYGEKAESGPNSVYAGGLWVRTSLDTEMQDAARDSMQAGLFRYAAGKPWTRPIGWLDPSKGNLMGQLVGANLSIRYKDWRVGVVTDRSGPTARIGFPGGLEAPLTGLPDALKVGDVVAAEPAGGAWEVRTVPEVSGGFIAMDPHNGRVLAMQGGFDSRLGSFNRATQALRQPGSTIKPFVYATALDNGMTPATMVPDTPYCVYQGAALGQKCFRNFENEGGGGEHTMRWGLEQSRNLMTVHIASDIGMENVTRTFSRLGIGNYQNYLAFALGAGDTTVLKMVDAYSALFDHGVQHPPSVIDFVQDRHGKVIWRSDKRDCTGCNMPEWDGKPMPRIADAGKPVLDPRTAYQVVHMMEGVIQRGTAVRVRALGLPLAGKTGTTSGPTNVWFIGGSPDLIAGTYVGYDQPRNLGGWVQGANIAAPIFIDFVKATRDRWSDRPFLAPAGVRMVRINRQTGTRVFDQEPTDDPLSPVIWEAFKPDTEPRRAQRQDEIDAMRETILAQLRQREQGPANNAVRNQEAPPEDFVEEQGGLY